MSTGLGGADSASDGSATTRRGADGFRRPSTFGGGARRSRGERCGIATPWQSFGARQIACHPHSRRAIASRRATRTATTSPSRTHPTRCRHEPLQPPPRHYASPCHPHSRRTRAGPPLAASPCSTACTAVALVAVLRTPPRLS
uniref:Uncharacterized protein n=1 Tax=Oryza sativa subsp. japonica TaxID=39947 RepID=Q69PB4_ORYSJ|nr:hypothetical protein [Oryza sativa Japonica Group]